MPGVDEHGFFGLTATDDPFVWRFEVVPHLSSGIGALFGGCGLGACVEVLEHVLGRRLVWATAQFLSFARPPAVVEIRVNEAVRGHQISQVRAIGSVDGEEIFTVNAATGDRPERYRGTWAIRPDVPGPEDSAPRVVDTDHRGTLMDRLDMRLAAARPIDDLPGPAGDGRSSIWIRLPGTAITASTLAIFGDYVPFGISQTLGERVGGNSLDNTIRVLNRTGPQWVLADIRVHGLADGFGHGLIHLWGEDGVLLGTAAQSTIVRSWKGQPRS